MHEIDHYGEPQVYLDEQATIQNGNLIIELEKQDHSCDPSRINEYFCVRQFNEDSIYHYTSGWVESTSKYNVSINSYVEARIKVPRGPGYWPAFWIFKGHDVARGFLDYSELDIFEMLGDEDSTTTTNNMHGDTPGHPEVYFAGGILINEILTSYEDVYLTYGVKWLSDSIFFFINGYEVRRDPASQIANWDQYAPMRVTFNIALRPDLIDPNQHFSYKFPPDPNMTNDSMFIDWVKVYEFNDNSSPLTQKAPYVINPGKKYNKTQTQVLWQLDNSMYNNSTGFCKIEYGTDSNNLNKIVDDIPQHSTDHLFTTMIYHSAEGQRIYYKVSIQGISQTNQPFSKIQSFRSAPADNSTDIKFIAYGNTSATFDGGTSAHHNEVCGAILDEINADPDCGSLLLHTGNWVLEDDEKNWRDEYFNINDNNATDLRAKTVLMGANGNNEGIGDVFNKYLPFAKRGNNLTGYRNVYSFEYGPVQFVVFDISVPMQPAPNKTMYFLDSLMQATIKPWKVFVFHIPIKTLKDDVASQSTISLLKQKAEQYGVQAMIMGNQTYYAHWVENGIHYLNLGSGGTVPNAFDFNKLLSQNEIMASSVPHFAKFDIQDDLMYVDVIQGASYLGYNQGRKIEQFAIPKKTFVSANETVNYNNPSTHPILTDQYTIKSTGKLIINTPWHISKNGSIEVEPQGKLIVESASGSITNTNRQDEHLLLINHANGIYNENDDYWNGIEIWGDKTQSQVIDSQTGIPTYQGMIEVNDGATISHMLDGIMAIKKDAYGVADLSKTGGIIMADSAQFVNNKNSIWIGAYQPVDANYAFIPNISEIRNSSFLIDDQMPDGQYFYSFIGLWNMNDLLITGNRFRNISTQPLLDRGKGIITFDASYKVDYWCRSGNDPCTDVVKNEFEGLYYGIQSFDVRNRKVDQVNNSVFDDCYKSIYLNNSNSAKLTNNIITIPEVSGTTFPYGIYLDGGNAFKVEENSITATVMPGTRGILLSNTGQKDNEIYKNTFNNLNIAIQPQFNNRGYSAGNEGKGLRLFCNENTNLSYDVWVTGKQDEPNMQGVGIAEAQQDSYTDQNNIDFDLPAGNVFSPGLRDMADWDLSNYDAEHLFYYYYNNAANKQKPDSASNAGLVGLTNNNTCPSKTSITISLPLLYSDLAVAQITLNSSTTLLNIFRDGGNINLDQEVETTQPWDVYVQFNELIGESPYLSDEVLIATIENPAFTSLMIKLIMIANPQSTHSSEVMTALTDRIPPLPESYLEDIQAQAGTSSQLELLENNRSADRHAVRRINQDLKRIYRTDIINSWAQDSLLALTQRQSDLVDQYELANLYLSRGEYEHMNSLLDDIPTNYELEGITQSDHDNLISLLEIAQDVYEDDFYIGELETTDKTVLENLVSLKRPMISSMALSLLKRDNPDYVYDEIILEPQEYPPARKGFGLDNETGAQSVLKLYPNPAYDFVTLEYRTQQLEYNRLFVQIKDVNGRIIKSENLVGGDTEEILNLSVLSSGSYTVFLFADNTIIAMEKLNIIK